jgi:hypothetical protein
VTRDRLWRISVAGAFVFLTSVYLLSEWRDLDRGPHIDEVEHLHVAVLMARGERVYVDFAEHHPPLFWAMLRPLVPKSESVAAMQGFVVRARLMSGAITALGIVAAALVLWRACGNAWTVVTFVGFVFAAGGVWRNGLGDVRPDSTALGLWWAGAALVLLARRPTLRGLGLGLVFLSIIVKPQWPLSSLVIGIVFLADGIRDRRALLRSSAIAIIVAIAGLAATACLADLRAVYFHVFTLTRAMVAEAFPEGVSTRPPFFGCPPMLRPATMVPAALLVVIAWIRRRSTFGAPRLIAILLILAATSLIEILFVYPYPEVDFRFYAFWSLAAGAILALLPQSAAALLPDRTALLRMLRKAIPAAGVLVALVVSLDLIDPPRMLPDRFWQSTVWMEARLRPGDTIWNGRSRHPLAAYDPNYYWFGLPEVIPVAIKLAKTETGRHFLPPITEQDLPPCRIERGLDKSVRFTGEPFPTLPVARACFARLRDRGIFMETPFERIWMVRR